MSDDLVVGGRVVATAPVRVADVGGWTDTWFGSPGRVCHLAVGPAVDVEAHLVPRSPHGPMHLLAPDVGFDGFVGPGGPSTEGSWSTPQPGAQPLLEHAIGAVLSGVELPPEVGLDVRISSSVPAGASLGTSASVVVALLGALDTLVAGGRRFPSDLAVLAHQVETIRAGREAGVQDQWAAAMGGVGLLAIGPYPDVRHEPIELSASASAELEERAFTIVFGPHDSSQVHGEVINAMVGCGGIEHDRARLALRRLASLAGDAASALADGAIDQWAEVLVAATEAQRELHPALIGAPHQAAIDAVRRAGATGWKVNGAGGDGGSLTVVAPKGGVEPIDRALADLDGTWRTLRLAPHSGVRVVHT